MAAHSSEMLVNFYPITWHHITKGSILDSNHIKQLSQHIHSTRCLIQTQIRTDCRSTLYGVENGGRGREGKEKIRKIRGDKKEVQKKKDNDNDEGQYSALSYKLTLLTSVIELTQVCTNLVPHNPLQIHT